MLTYTIRRLLISIPTLLFIALVIFLLLELAPGDPMASMPLTIPDEVKQRMREALGLGRPWYTRFGLWLYQFFVIEPQYWFDGTFGTNFADGAQRIISFQSRSPVFDTIAERMPQTLWVVGMSYVVGVAIALPIGIISAYRQYSVFDQAGTFVSMIGFSVPPFFSGVLLIVIFSVQLKWLPSIYDTTHVVTSWDSFVVQFKQMIMPVMVLALQTTAQVSRYMRASMLEIITEQIFKVNGLGQLLIIALQGSDIPMVMTITFLLAVLIVLMNLIADVLYGILDPSWTFVTRTCDRSTPPFTIATPRQVGPIRWARITLAAT